MEMMIQSLTVLLKMFFAIVEYFIIMFVGLLQFVFRPRNSIAKPSVNIFSKIANYEQKHKRPDNEELKEGKFYVHPGEKKKKDAA